MRVPKKGRIRAKTEEGYGRSAEKVVSKQVPENGRIQATTGEG